MKAYKHLVKHSIDAGMTLSVWDGEEWQVKKSTSYNDIIEAIESVDESQLSIRNPLIMNDNNKPKQVGWARIVLEFEQEDEESINDTTINEYMDEWQNSYDKYQANLSKNK